MRTRITGRRKWWYMLLVGGAFALLGSKGCQEKSAAVDPLKEKAREKYTEGRRLFLTCDPDNYRRALQLFEDALAYWEDYPEAAAGLAETISMYYGFRLPEEEFQRGYMAAQRATRLDPNLDMGYRAMADLFRHRKNPETGEYDHASALNLINMALEKDPNSAENLYVKGSIYLQLDPEKGREILSLARQKNPNLPKIYFNLAAAHQLLGDAARLKAAAGENPQENENLARAHYRKGIEFLKIYQKLVPGDLAGYCSEAFIQMADGNTVEARQTFEKTLTANPNPDVSQLQWRLLALMSLARMAREKKDLEAARVFLDRGLALAPRNIDFLREAIEVAKERGNEAARAEYEEQLRAVIEERRAQASAPAEGETESREEEKQP